MSLCSYNPTGISLLYAHPMERANPSLSTRNGDGRVLSSCGVLSVAKKAAFAVRTSRANTQTTTTFCYGSTVRVSRHCSGTASGQFMRPAAARSSASATPPCGLRFPSKSCSERAPKRFLLSLRKCRASALGSMAHSLVGAPIKIGKFNSRRPTCIRTT